MATHSGNFSLGNLPDVDDNDVFDTTDSVVFPNLMQACPHTKIFEGKTGLTFRHANLMNCDVPPGSMVEDCLTVNMEFCKHLILEEQGESPLWSMLPDEPENCKHVDSVYEIVTDGQTFTKYNRSHRVVS